MTGRRPLAPPTPAHRRRRLAALAALGGLALVAGIAVGSGSGGGDQPAESDQEEPEPTVCTETGRGTLERVAGQQVAVRMEDVATEALRRQARDGSIGGVVLFPVTTDPDAVGPEVAKLQAAALRGGNPPLLVAIDQEGGVVKRFTELPPTLSAPEIGAAGDAATARRQGQATARGLLRAGVTVDLAPVLDIPASPDQFMAARAFGSSSATVAELGGAFAEGLRAGGVAATAKHFPGLGRADVNTDLGAATVTDSRAALEADLTPFRTAIASGIDLVMVSSASYPALGSNRPASLAPEITNGLLRGDFGFDGVAITDDLLAPAIAADRDPDAAAVAASDAGADILLFAAAPVPSPAPAIAAAVRSGRLDEAALRSSCTRILELKNATADGSAASADSA